MHSEGGQLAMQAAESRSPCIKRASSMCTRSMLSESLAPAAQGRRPEIVRLVWLAFALSDRDGIFTRIEAESEHL